MPVLDVSEVLNDPLFCDTSLKVMINATAVGNDGRLQTSTMLQAFKGVVTQANGTTSERLADGSRIKGAISVITTYRLSDGTSGRASDVVVWQNRRYTVSQVSDYSTYGRGFVEAICDLIPLNGG